MADARAVPEEGWGLIIVEAGLHGTPSIAFVEAGGPSESILHGLTGLLARDYADMRAQVRLLLEDEPLRTQLGAAARDHARSFSWDSATERLEHTLLSVLGRRARPDQPATLGPRTHDLHQVQARPVLTSAGPEVDRAIDSDDSIDAGAPASAHR